MKKFNVPPTLYKTDSPLYPVYPVREISPRLKVKTLKGVYSADFVKLYEIEFDFGLPAEHRNLDFRFLIGYVQSFDNPYKAV